MNITFLIGNGFDLNLGLNTEYKSFLKEYAKVKDTDLQLIKDFKEHIKENLETWAKAELAFGTYTRDFEGDSDGAIKFCMCHENFCNALAKYLDAQETNIPYDKLMDTLIKGFIHSLQNLFIGMRDTHIDSINDAASNISGGYKYNFINFNYTSTAKNIYDVILNKHISLGTRTYRNTNQTNKLGQFRHVHGTTKEDMVLGLNDESQIEAINIFEGSDPLLLSQLIKQSTNASNQRNNDQKTFELLKESDLIIIYGMSLGETDALWWNRIGHLMSQKSSLHLVIHCFDAPEDGLIRTSYLMYENEIRKLFVSYCDIDDAAKNRIMQRIHIQPNNIFKPLLNIATGTAVDQ